MHALRQLICRREQNRHAFYRGDRGNGQGVRKRLAVRYDCMARRTQGLGDFQGSLVTVKTSYPLYEIVFTSEAKYFIGWFRLL